MTFERVAGIAACGVVAFGVAAGFAAIGTPRHMRSVEADERRIDDLRALAIRINDAYGAIGAGSRPLPARLGAPGAVDEASDPFTRRPYRYVRVDDRRYRLCATFETDAAGADGGSWPHHRGPACFAFDRGTRVGTGTVPGEVRSPF